MGSHLAEALLARSRPLVEYILAKAFELVVTPGIFGFLGWLLDHKVGTTPLFTLLFTLIVFGYVKGRFTGAGPVRSGRQRRRRGLPALPRRNP